ncbi:hypothetical protein N7X57_12140 [Lactiplantibacillus paraplantarum]|uniref:hypothetical protein n=1 Tax=Lactiplantibacillus paraplantarum TaxID=60520 RepID=UPI0007E3876C|nr:hypothetical protein [Lactiplantibacillus paraplantarum]MCW1911171.1 hypothetical protein [Lactiplantibacillus paraplantarum]OAX76051.1 hypothetical protein A0U96_13160 [Lactiplantibacillus plantarum]RDG08204.1 hypothetical protein DQM08_14885 [Lactiplantibacillus paraplantarum]
MREGRERLFSGFMADTENSNSKFTVENIDNSCNQQGNNDVYGIINQLITNNELKKIANEGNEKEFIAFLQSNGFLPEKVVFNHSDPTVQEICNKTWCTTTHYLAYAEAGVVVLAVAAAMSVTIAAFTSTVLEKDFFDQAIEMAAVMKDKRFADKVKVQLRDWLNQEQAHQESEVQV